MTPYNPFSLDGKTVLITGASSGIGRETAIQCSNLGARIIITGRNEDRLTDTLSSLKGNSNNMIISDLTSQEDLERLVAEVPLVNGVVLCAGRGVQCELFHFC